MSLYSAWACLWDGERMFVEGENIAISYDVMRQPNISEEQAAACLAALRSPTGTRGGLSLGEQKIMIVFEDGDCIMGITIGNSSGVAIVGCRRDASGAPTAVLIYCLSRMIAGLDLNVPAANWLHANAERLGLNDAPRAEQAASSEACNMLQWGAMIGSRSRDMLLTPSPCEALRGLNVVSVACGKEHMLLLTDLDRVFAVGDNSRGALGVPGSSWAAAPQHIPQLDAQRVQGVQCGWYHSMCVTRNGDVFAWGDGSEGRLGLGGEAQATVAAVTTVQDPNPAWPHRFAVVQPRAPCPAPPPASEAAGAEEGPPLPKKKKGVFRRWGGKRKPPAPPADDVIGVTQRAVDDLMVHSPTLLEALSARRVVDIAAGASHNLFLLDDGAVMACGARRAFGALGGDGTAMLPEPVTVPHNAAIGKVCAGEGHSMLLSGRHGHVYVAGSNFKGQQALGGEPTTGISAFHAVALPGPVAHIACGGTHSVVALEDGRLFSWGGNDRGQCGVGGSDHYNGRRYWTSPQECKFFRPGAAATEQRGRPTQLVAGERHTLVLVDDGVAWACGSSLYGQTGIKTTTEASSFFMVGSDGEGGVELCRNEVDMEILPRFFSLAAAGNTSLGSTEVRLLPLGRDLLSTLPAGRDMVEAAAEEEGKEEELSGPGVVALVGPDGSRVQVHGAMLVARCGALRVWPDPDEAAPRLGSAPCSELELPVPTNGPATRALARFLYGGSRYISGHVEELGEAAAALQVAELQHICGGVTGPAPESLLASDMARLVDNPAFADVAFGVEGRRVHAHRFVLSARCQYLETMLSSGMAESFAEEIPMPGSSHEAFLVVLHWLYADHLPEELDPGLAVEVMESAHAFGLEALTVACGSVIEKVVDADNVLAVFSRAEFFEVDELAWFCVEFLRDPAVAASVAASLEELEDDQRAALLRMAAERGIVLLSSRVDG